MQKRDIKRIKALNKRAKEGNPSYMENIENHVRNSSERTFTGYTGKLYYGKQRKQREKKLHETVVSHSTAKKRSLNGDSVPVFERRKR